MKELTLFGAHVSPYVRKVRLVLDYLDLEYRHIPVVPFGGQQPEEFKAHSPLGKIPLLKVGDDYIPDSSVICSYLITESDSDLMPDDLLLRAKTQWFEEYADSFMVSVIAGHLFAERILAPVVFKRDPVQADIDKAINDEIPTIFTYLEKELEHDFLICNKITLADLAVGGLFIAMHHCGVWCDVDKWPATAAYIDRLMDQDCFKKIVSEERAILKQFAG